LDLFHVSLTPLATDLDGMARRAKTKLCYGTEVRSNFLGTCRLGASFIMAHRKKALSCCAVATGRHLLAGCGYLRGGFQPWRDPRTYLLRQPKRDGRAQGSMEKGTETPSAMKSLNRATRLHLHRCSRSVQMDGRDGAISWLLGPV